MTDDALTFATVLQRRPLRVQPHVLESLPPLRLNLD